MSNYFKKYSDGKEEQNFLYQDIFLDLIKEIKENYIAAISQSTDILNIEYMPTEFLIEWMDFYGVTLGTGNRNEINRNALKRWKEFLRNRGEEQTIYSVLQSGGSLFAFNTYPIKLYWWDNVPSWIEGDPQDGYIYVVCQNREVIKDNDLIDSIKPAGYAFDIVYRNPSIGLWPYYGDLRFGYGIPEEEYGYLPKDLIFDTTEDYELYNHLSYINNITYEQAEQYCSSKIDKPNDITIENISLGIDENSQPVPLDSGRLQRLEERWSTIQSDLFFTMDKWLESASWPVAQQSDFPSEYILYKALPEEKKSNYASLGDDEYVYGNFGSFDYEKISDITLTPEGTLSTYTPFDLPDGYPSPFRPQEATPEPPNDWKKTPRVTMSTGQIVDRYGQNIKFDENPETGEIDVPKGFLINRTTVIERKLMYFLNNGYAIESDGTIDEHATIIDAYIKNKTGFWKDDSSGIETWRSDGSYSGTQVRYFEIEIPYNTRNDRKVAFGYKFSSSGSRQGLLRFWVNNEMVSILPVATTSLDVWHIQVLELSDNISVYPRSKIKVEYIHQSDDVCVDIDLGKVCLREPIIEKYRQTSTVQDKIAKADILFHRNWSFETLYRNNLSMETLYYQYNNSPTLLDASITPSKKSTGQQDGLYKWVMVREDGIDCLGTDRSYIYTGTGLVAAGCDFYFELPEEKTLSFRLKHVTNSSRYFAIYIDGTAVSNRVYSQNTTQSNWLTITHTFSAGSHFIIFRNIASTESAGSPSNNYAIIDLTDFKKYIFPFTRYNPPEIGIQPVKYPDGVYKYIPKGPPPVSPLNTIAIISVANNLSSADALSVVNQYITNPTVVSDNLSLLGHLSGTDWIADTLNENNYIAYSNAIQQYWNNSEIEPSESTAWPPEEPVYADLLTGLAYHYGFGDTGAVLWESDGGIGGTMELNSRSSATGGIAGKIDGGVSFSAGDGKAYRNVAAETVDGQLLVFGRKNTDWSAAVWLKGTDSADTNDGRRSALELNTNSGAGYVVTLGTSDGGLPALLYGTPPTAPLVEGVSDILDNSWHLLVATHDTEAEEVALYCDGQLVGTSGDSALYAGISGLTAPFFVGRSNWPAVALCLVGTVDEVALWHGRSISQAEVTALWNNGDGLPFEDWT